MNKIEQEEMLSTLCVKMTKYTNQAKMYLDRSKEYTCMKEQVISGLKNIGIVVCETKEGYDCLTSQGIWRSGVGYITQSNE